ncbi:hypothetical protein [Chlorobaculum limnaeum]|uniref:hypothetical protein n=1 Tax=Chlorobaculum limnaeum TaxID=274537 RepID=UPI0012EDB6FC|nr:hypothetical protein [Chlorobaculum limnaeum]
MIPSLRGAERRGNPCSICEAREDGSPRPDKSGLAMTWKRESVIEFRHCEERSDVAIHAESAKAVKMDRHAPTSRDSR